MAILGEVHRDSWAGASALDRERMEGEIERFVASTLADVTGYAGLYRAALSVLDVLRHRGFELDVFDEDDESRVTLLEPREDRTGIVLTFVWDDDEGANALVQFPPASNS